MMVHIRRNHAFFRLQRNDSVKDGTACIHICNFGKDHPYLVCIVNLALFSAYKKSLFLIIEILPGSFCFQTDFLRKSGHLFLISKDLGNFLYTFCTVNINTLNSTLFVQSFCPVDESPEAILLFQNVFLIKLLCGNFHLTIRTSAEFFQSFHIFGCLIIVIQSRSEKHGIIQKERIIRNDFRLRKQAGTYLSVIFCLTCKQIQAAFYKVIIFECFIVCQSLQSQISKPQTAVSLRSVLKNILHAVMKGTKTDTVQFLHHLILSLNRFYIRHAYGGNAAAYNVLHYQLPFHGSINGFNLQITESISSWKYQCCRKYINVEPFLLNPSTADPSIIILGFLSHLFCDFAEFQFEKCRCILRTSHRGKFQCHISNLMISKIQAKLIAFFHMIIFQVIHRISVKHLRIYTVSLTDIHNFNRAYQSFF